MHFPVRTARMRFNIATLVCLAPSALLAADAYEIDATHSTILFRVKHLDVSYFYGRFNGLSGMLTLDESDASKSSIELTVETESVDSGNAKRNGHLKTADFFNAQQFPQIRFKSTSFKQLKDGEYEITGELSLHGISRNISVVAQRTGSGPDPWGGYRTGLESTFSIKRSDFGMDQMLNAVGDDVRLIVSLEAKRK